MLPGTDPRVTALETELVRVRRDFEAALDAVPADRMHQAPPGRWTPAQLLWHVAKVERGIARLIERLDAGILPTTTVPPGPSLGGMLTLLKQDYRDRSYKLAAPDGLRPPDTVDVVAERARLDDGRAQLFAAIRAAGPRLSLMRHDHIYFGSYDGWQWVLFVGKHEERHLLQLQEVLGQTA